MFGCLRKLGCLVVVIVGAALWFTRAAWVPVLDRVSGRDRDVVASPITWQPLDQAGAERGERAVRTLAARRGPVYVNLRAGDLASYAFLSLSSSLPPALRDAQTTVVGDRVYLRAVVSASDFGGLAGSTVGQLLRERDTLRLGGTFDILRPGLAQFRVRDVQVGRLPVPAAAIPRLVRSVRRGGVPDGVDADGFPIPVPDYIGDVRIARGRITLYKTPS